MRLILVRHGEADPNRSGVDAARQLTEIGHQQAELTAQYIAQHFNPDLFVVSPYIRAKQTLSYIQKQFPNVPTQVYENITPDDPAEAAFHWLADFAEETIVVVCHMNIIAYLAALLKGGVPESFNLAEARVYEHPVMIFAISEEKARFVPQVIQ